MKVVWDLFFMFGGVAVMMLGMKIMGGGLEKFAGGSMKKMLGKVTNNRFAGLGVGVAVTSIIQSSTATTVMLVGFVNIGLMTLVQATGVIMGANIGTTVTAHIVSLSGVGGAIDIGAIAAMIGLVGVLMAMLVKNEKVINIGNILAGLGMIFIGLEFISNYAKLVLMPDNKPIPLVTNFFQGDVFPLLLVVIGIVITALVHSSSTITSLMVVLASSGILSFDNALFLALGSNIGTCITSVLASVGTNVNAKRTAIVHLLFNVFGCVLFIAPIWIWSGDITNFFASISGDVGQQIAIFHTAFNVITTIILFPLASYVVKLACLIIKDKPSAEEAKVRLTFIDDRLLNTPQIAVANTKKEIIKMASIAKENINLSAEMLLDRKVDNEKLLRDNEVGINFLNRGITNYLTKLMGQDLSVYDDKAVGTYYHVVSDIERVGDYAENVMEYALRLREADADFSEHAKEELSNVINKINELFDLSMSAFEKVSYENYDRIMDIEESIDEASVELENKHIDRVKRNACTAELGSIYLQTVANLERVGDHITNIAKSIKGYSVRKV